MGAQTAKGEPKRPRRRWFGMTLAIVVTAASAGSLGWYAARRYGEPAPPDGAGPAAQAKCRTVVERELIRRAGHAVQIGFADSYLVGTDESGRYAAWVRGDATPDGQARVGYGCSLSGYDSVTNTWGGVTMTV
ncbi:hypothetical protein HDA40_006852 [Hamadaea flava]|uniref:Secreted protein n=1 Tax=Hamadaea flava TaxID=1742688 RepID=A0ABV8LTV6_9ACTN|nr:hypothetical protein [Hamadaea flava]MCP2328345.1 hypothetical protein [Hamadaea flava]